MKRGVNKGERGHFLAKISCRLVMLYKKMQFDLVDINEETFYNDIIN